MSLLGIGICPTNIIVIEASANMANIKGNPGNTVALGQHRLNADRRTTTTSALSVLRWHYVGKALAISAAATWGYIGPIIRANVGIIPIRRKLLVTRRQIGCKPILSRA